MPDYRLVTPRDGKVRETLPQNGQVFYGTLHRLCRQSWTSVLLKSDMRVGSRQEGLPTWQGVEEDNESGQDTGGASGTSRYPFRECARGVRNVTYAAGQRWTVLPRKKRECPLPSGGRVRVRERPVFCGPCREPASGPGGDTCPSVLRGPTTLTGVAGTIGVGTGTRWSPGTGQEGRAPWIGLLWSLIVTPQGLLK